MSALRYTTLRLASLLLGLVILGTLQPSAYCQISFSAPATYTVGANADYPVAADLDGDGNLDVAVANGTKITVLYGHGDGAFDPPIDYPVGYALAQIIAVDLNHDGKLDLVDAVQGHSSVAVLLNKGRRKFGKPAFYTVGTKPYGVCAGDFNGDGHPDLAVSNDNSNNISVLINNGDGTFKPAVFYGAGSYPARIVTADFNHDGKLDLAVSNYVSADVILYYGDGAGNFTTGPSYSVGAYPADILLGDFNRDGVLDLATLNAFSGNVSVLDGQVGGTFTPAAFYSVGFYPEYGAIADLDGDGYPDLVVPKGGTSNLSVLRNHGDGTLESPIDLTTPGSDDRSCAIGDFNGDGKPDIAVTSSNNGTISLFFNTSDFQTGLVSKWPGDGNFEDVIGGNNGTPFGGVSFTPAVYNDGFLFDGYTGRIFVPDADNLKFYDDFALSAWIKVREFPAFPNGEGEILFRGDDRIGTDSYYLKVYGNGDLAFLVGDAYNEEALIQAPVPSGKFVFVAATYHQGWMRLYENGKLVVEMQTSVVPFRDLDPNASPGIGIGNVQSGNYFEYFNGIIDDLKAYNTAAPRISPTALTLSAPTVTGGQTVTATLTVDDSPLVAAHATLSVANSAASVPALVSIAAGRYHTTFKIKTTPVTSPQTATISATIHGVTVSTNLTILP